MKSLVQIIIAGFVVVLLYSCSNGSDPLRAPRDIKIDDGGDDGEKIVIVDWKGEEWDITHAVKVYGFDPAKFGGGGGRTSIPPINNPQFFLPGDQGYPEEDATFLMIGFEKNNESRAYPVSVMKEYEIANDWFGSTPVAVAF